MKDVNELAEKWACNYGIPHTNRDKPAWHYDAIAFKAGHAAGYEEAKEEIETLYRIIRIKSEALKKPCPKCGREPLIVKPALKERTNG